MPRRKQRSHWGSVIEIVPGKKYGIRWTEDTPKGRKKRYETFYGTRKQAHDRKDELHQLVRERGADKASITLGRAWKEWYLPAAEKQIAAGKLKGRTLGQYEYTYSKYIDERWGKVPVSEVAPIQIEEWLHTLTKSVGQRAKGVMSNILKECVKRQVIQANPAQVDMVESSLGRKYDKGIWTLEELDELAWRFRDEVTFYSLLLMAFGSCRPGESLGPKLSEVGRCEVDGMVFASVEVMRQVIPTTGEMTSDDDVKNQFSIRTAYVPEPWCWPLFRRVKTANPHDEYITDHGYGMHFTQEQTTHAWNAAFKKGVSGGIPRHPWKNVRPAWETWMNWRNHVPREKIEKIMGHKGQGITAVYYDRPLGVQLMEEIAGSFKRHPFESPHPWREWSGADNWGI